jgi:thiol:disulfide interchange protein DsbC
MNHLLKHLFKLGVAALMLFGVAAVYAQSADEIDVKEKLEKNMGEGAQVDAVRKTPYSGLYEVQASGNLFYTDEEGKYVFVGQVIEARSRRNLTHERREEMNKITFSDLPLDKAIKRVKGNGSRVIAVFSDPNCGHCKRLEANLEELDNVTIYTFMYNILSPDSAKKSKNVWCAKDRTAAWANWMLKNKVPPSTSAKCEDPGRDVFELGRKLRVDGTPTIYFQDGRRVAGAISVSQFEARFARLK